MCNGGCKMRFFGKISRDNRFVAVLLLAIGATATPVSLIFQGHYVKCAGDFTDYCHEGLCALSEVSAAAVDRVVFFARAIVNSWGGKRIIVEKLDGFEKCREFGGKGDSRFFESVVVC